MSRAEDMDGRAAVQQDFLANSPTLSGLRSTFSKPCGANGAELGLGRSNATKVSKIVFTLARQIGADEIGSAMIATTLHRAKTKSFNTALAAASVFVTASTLVSLTLAQDQGVSSTATWSLRGTIAPDTSVVPAHVDGKDEARRRTVATLFRS